MPLSEIIRNYKTTMKDIVNLSNWMASQVDTLHKILHCAVFTCSKWIACFLFTLCNIMLTLKTVGVVYSQQDAC